MSKTEIEKILITTPENRWLNIDYSELEKKEKELKIKKEKIKNGEGKENETRSKNARQFKNVR